MARDEEIEKRHRIVIDELKVSSTSYKGQLVMGISLVLLLVLIVALSRLFQ